LLERLKIFEFYAPYKFVLFDHNPEQLKMTRRLSGGGRGVPTNNQTGGGVGGPSGNFGVQGNGSDLPTMTISKARLVGGEVKPMCDILLGWMAPLSEAAMAALNFLAQAAGRTSPIGARSPILLVQWGPPKMGFTFTATMTQLDIQYVRVSALGVPTHATINMTLKEEPSILSLTNPTSGGRPGRSRHVMIADETLQSVATNAFGTPGAWRAIAEVNGIDDPGSVRPGDVVYLPAKDELRSLAEATR
jgi:hypothetical protein